MASSTRETLTLQVGRYANFVGTHFWNYQDEVAVQWREEELRDAYDQASLYRAGRDSRGELTPTPRLLIFDTRDGLGGLHPMGPLRAGGSGSGSSGGGGSGGGSTASEPAPASLLRHGLTTTVIREDAYPKNSFLRHLEREDDDSDGEEGETEAEGGTGEYLGAVAGDSTAGGNRAHPFGLDDAVSTWSDFLKALTHPATFQELPFRDAGASVFDSFAAGGAELLGGETQERYHDAVRRLLEEADSPQGAQMLSDAQGGCLGLSSGLLRGLREECRGASFLCFITEDDASAAAAASAAATAAGTGNRAAVSRAINLSLALDAFAECNVACSVLGSSAAAGVSRRRLAVDSSKPYHTSAVLATALDTATAPCRFGGLLDGRESSSNGGSSSGGGGRAMRLAEWAAAAGDSWCGGGGSGGGSGGVSLTELELCFPFPWPDATEETLREQLVAPAATTPEAWHAARLPRLLSPLTPAPRRRRRSSRRGFVGSLAAPPLVVASELLVARGLRPPLERQHQVLEAALARCGAPRRTAVALATPLGIPLSFPAIFRGDTDVYGGSSGGRSGGGGGGGGRGGEEQPIVQARAARHILRDSAAVLGAACATSRLRDFCEDLLESFAPARPVVARELERGGVQRDDATEVGERLRELLAACPSGGSGGGGCGGGYGGEREDCDGDLMDLEG